MTQKQKQKNKSFFVDTKRNNKVVGSERIWKISSRFSLIFIVILGISFIISVNSLSVKGFMLQELKNRTKELATESNNIELDIMAKENYSNIDKRAQEMKMVKIDKVEYYTPKPAEMAKK